MKETNLTNTSARQMARLLFGIEKSKREKIVWCLDSSFRTMVLEEIHRIEKDTPLEFADTIPPGRIPNCS